MLFTLSIRARSEFAPLALQLLVFLLRLPPLCAQPPTSEIRPSFQRVFGQNRIPGPQSTCLTITPASFKVFSSMQTARAFQNWSWGSAKSLFARALEFAAFVSVIAIKKAN
jgi:hypothetical protein